MHDDVIKWKHFPRYWLFVRGIHRSPVNSPHKGQWRGALMFSLICARINGWVNKREAGDLRRDHAHYDVIVMYGQNLYVSWWHAHFHWIRGILKPINLTSALLIKITANQANRCILNSDLAKSRFSITIPLVQSFWNFSQSTLFSLFAKVQKVWIVAMHGHHWWTACRKSWS